MAIRTAMITVLVLMICSTGFTVQSTDLTVETENGKKLVIKDVISGYFESIMDYDYDQFTETNNIPLKNGYAFGFEFRLPNIPDGDSIVIDVIVQLPEGIDNGKEKLDIVKGKIQLDRTASDIQHIFWIFDKEEPEYFITGTWTYSLYNKGNLLISRKFRVEPSLSSLPVVEPSQKYFDKDNLLLAARNVDISEVEKLLAKGADVNAKNNYGDTALKRAKEFGNQDIVQILKDAGAKE